MLGGLNGYAYAPNPIGWVDPIGLSSIKSYSSCRNATKAALDAANPKSIRKNKEYGGLIYTKNGKYYHTIPVAGTERSYKPAYALPQVPRGAKVVGDYHTHGDYSRKDHKGNFHRTTKDYDTEESDNFSRSDKRITNMALASNRCHKSYLGTPSGVYKINDINGESVL